MDTSRFTPDAPGHLIATLQRQMAFVPDPLPPKIDLAAIAIPLANAMQALGELKGACRRLQNPYVVVRPLQRQEALTSSAMEGTFTTADNLLLAEAGLERESDDSTREVVNYLTALNEALDSLKRYPISHRILKDAHRMLLSGLSSSRGAWKRPGEFKIEQNWIGGATIDKARFVPPPPAEAFVCMNTLEAYINREKIEYPTPLMDLGLVHYQLETIHPFADGNGRVGRMLISLMAVHSGLLEMPILYVSPVMERYKDEYIDLMFAVSARGEWVRWLCFFFERICETCKEAIATIDRLIALQSEYRSLAGKTARSSSLIQLVDFLFETPVISVTEASRRLQVTYQAAKNAIDKLVDSGILKERENQYPKIFFAPEIIRASRPAVQSA